jgi:hypothetical protein
LLQVRTADIDIDHRRHLRLVGLLASVIEADRRAVGRQRQVAQPVAEGRRRDRLGGRAGARNQQREDDGDPAPHGQEE